MKQSFVGHGDEWSYYVKGDTKRVTSDVQYTTHIMVDRGMVRKTLTWHPRESVAMIRDRINALGPQGYLDYCRTHGDKIVETAPRYK